MRAILKKIANRILWSLPSSGTLRGYDDQQLVEFIFHKTARVAQKQEPWPEISEARSVLDFGGGFGLHYLRAKQEYPLIKWAVVETPEIVTRASQLSTDALRFFADI